jgi:energy-converting hydrogenase Eha subunit A
MQFADIHIENLSHFFLMSLMVVHVLLVFVFLGVVYVDAKYVETVSSIIRVCMCLILIIRFNPFAKPELKKYDRELIFTAAMLLLTNEAITKYIIGNYDIPRYMKNIVSNGASVTK